MGARPLARKIDELIRVPLSKKILFERVKNSDVTAVLMVDVDKGTETIEFEITPKKVDHAAIVGKDGVIYVQGDAVDNPR